jgi:hypothetical protein
MHHLIHPSPFASLSPPPPASPHCLFCQIPRPHPIGWGLRQLSTTIISTSRVAGSSGPAPQTVVVNYQAGTRGRKCRCCGSVINGPRLSNLIFNSELRIQIQMRILILIRENPSLIRPSCFESLFPSMVCFAQFPDEQPGSYFRELRSIFWVKILQFFDADPGWKKFESTRIRNTGRKYQCCGSVINGPRLRNQIFNSELRIPFALLPPPQVSPHGLY